jgi:pimeloyl-ACP methyl ester carboxylesterase
MPDRQWVITNRTVKRVQEPGGLVERVTDDAREALPVFRVGIFDPARITPRATALQVQRSVQIIPDEYVENYSDLPLSGGDIEGEPGTRRMFAELYRAMCDSPEGKGDTLFFIHGFNYSFSAAMKHYRDLYDLYVKPAASPIGRIIYFTWPSYGRSTRYPSDRAIAGPSGWLLGRLFAKVARFYRQTFAPEDGKPAPHCGRKIHLAAHSMGNQVLREFVRAVDEPGLDQPPLFGQVLLLHADLEWQAMEPGEPLHRLPEFCDRVHIYNHKHDFALDISENTKNADKRLGKHGPRDWSNISARTNIIDCSAPTPRNSVPQNDPFYPEVERILGGGRENLRERAIRHWGYLYRSRQVADIYAVLSGWSSRRIEEEVGTRVHREGPLYGLV